tara:strand:+ start:166 stop:657 length:492 start_codon:yes stop_codon:yes gene_type:complete
MGNFFIKSKFKNNNSGNVHLLDDFDCSVNDLTYVQYSTNNNFDFNEIYKNQNDLKIMFSNIQNKISKLEVVLDQKIDNLNKVNNNKIYTINEQINLIHKDLESLVNNDKILLENYQSILDNDVNSSKIYKLIKEKVDNDNKNLKIANSTNLNKSEQMFESCIT